MKTALQEAIDRFNLTAICSQESLDEILIKEKHQMMDFFIAGCNSTYGVDEPNPDYPDEREAEAHYNHIYK
jgi:hypothetical protein